MSNQINELIKKLEVEKQRQFHGGSENYWTDGDQENIDWVIQLFTDAVDSKETSLLNKKDNVVKAIGFIAHQDTILRDMFFEIIQLVFPNEDFKNDWKVLTFFIVKSI